MAAWEAVLRWNKKVKKLNLSGFTHKKGKKKKKDSGSQEQQKQFFPIKPETTSSTHLAMAV